MIIRHLQRIFAPPSKRRLSPPDKADYNAAENEFTSEGAPPSAESDAAAVPAANGPEADSRRLSPPLP